MSKCKGYAALEARAPLGPYSFGRRKPREHDIVIDIKYCGVCHSDIHQTRDTVPCDGGSGDIYQARRILRLDP